MAETIVIGGNFSHVSAWNHSWTNKLKLTLEKSLLLNDMWIHHLCLSPRKRGCWQVWQTLAYHCSSLQSTPSNIDLCIHIEHMMTDMHFKLCYHLTRIHKSFYKGNVTKCIWNITEENLTWGHESDIILMFQKNSISVSKYKSQSEPLFKKLKCLKIMDIYKLQQQIY